jgi:DinB family protein
MHPRIGELLQYLDTAREALRAAVERVPREWRERAPEPGRWSVAEILEHLSLVEASVTRLFTLRLAEARAGGLGSETETTPVLPTLGLEALPDRSYRVTASERVQPQGQLDAASAWAALEAVRQATREAILSGDGLALGEVIHPRPHPIFGPLNLYQWAAFIGGHEARHTAQILEIAAACAERSTRIPP